MATPQDIAAAIRSGAIAPDVIAAALSLGIPKGAPAGDVPGGPSSVGGYAPDHKSMRIRRGRERLAPDAYIVVPDAGILAPGDIVARKIQFKNSSVTLLGWSGIAACFDAGKLSADPFVQASVGVQLQINGKEFKTTNGDAVAFVNFATLFNNSDGYAALEFDLDKNDTLNVVYKSLQPVGGLNIAIMGVTFSVLERD